MAYKDRDPFGDIRALILKARLLRTVIRNDDSQKSRDNAIREYTHTLDALLDRLSEMYDAGDLDAPDDH
ncbi:hypothetical protein [Roseovarius sp. E0-M6]|uniref:hypothetical protein n=1 Tax=Roseovarius sp. E0-M6 TaxID=3127118 RepID=UPI00300FDBE0